MFALYWLYLGIGLILLEVATPGLVSLFFGMAALSVGLLVWAFPGVNQGFQWILFAVLSVLYLLLLRRLFKKIFSGSSEVSGGVADEFAGKMAVVVERIEPTRPGRVEFIGSTWKAEAATAIEPGTSVRIVGKENLTLRVEVLKGKTE